MNLTYLLVYYCPDCDVVLEAFANKADPVTKWKQKILTRLSAALPWRCRNKNKWRVIQIWHSTCVKISNNLEKTEKGRVKVMIHTYTL